MKDKKFEGEEKIKKFIEKEEIAENSDESIKIGTPIIPVDGIKKPWEKLTDDISLGNKIGWQQQKLKDLPTQGLFYPVGTEIIFRSATGAEIRHWSTLNETDLASLDDMLNYILERCVQVKFPDGESSSWRDIKEIDRFYLLLAIREYTFIKGENKLQVKVSETKKIDVVKDMIEYINFDSRIMKYYDDVERCFIFRFKDTNNSFIKATLPSVGVTNWLKNYFIRKRQNQEPVDEDFASFAPFIIQDWRGLNDDSYLKFIENSNTWSIIQVSVLTEFKKIFIEAVDPVVKYKDEEGGERTVPLNFQGGIKSILLISDPFDQLV